MAMRDLETIHYGGHTNNAHHSEPEQQGAFHGVTGGPTHIFRTNPR